MLSYAEKRGKKECEAVSPAVGENAQDSSVIDEPGISELSKAS